MHQAQAQPSCSPGHVIITRSRSVTKKRTSLRHRAEKFTRVKTFEITLYLPFGYFSFRKETADVIEDALEFMYTPWPDNSDKYALRSQLVDLVGDYYYFAPSHEVADIHSEVAPVYMYEFAHRSKFSFNAEWMGVDHGTNAPYDFGSPLVPRWPFQHSEADNNVSVFIMTTYANFARFGDPTPQPVSDVTWERFNSSHRAYLRVDANPKMAASFNPRRMAFWNDYYPELVELKFDTKKEVVSGASARVTKAIFFHVVLPIFLVILRM